MAKTRSLEVVISGDASQLNRTFKSVGQESDRLETRTHKLRNALAVMGTAGAGVAVVGLTKSVQAAAEAQKSQARLEAQLKAMNISYRAHANEINNVIQKTSQLSGLDDEDLQDAFTNIVRSTGSVSKGLQNVGLAADIARAKHIDVAKAGQLVGRVATGNVTALARYGIQIDKNATSQQALAELQRRFAGQADAYGKTAAGAQDRVAVATENLGEAVGGHLTPALATVANRLASFINFMGSSSRAATALKVAIGALAGTFAIVVVINRAAAAIGAMRAALARARTAVAAMRVAMIAMNATFLANPIVLITAAIAALGVGLVVAYKKSQTFRNIVNGAFDSVKGAAHAVASVVSNLANGAFALVKSAADKVAGAVNKIKDAFNAVKGAVGGIGGALKGAAGALNPFGDGVGKVASGGLPSIPNLTGVASPGNLHGANPALGPIAGIAGRFGLGIGAGRFDHSRLTTSGNVSYHSTGEALDFGNGVNTPQERSFQKYMHDRFGGRLAELIGPNTSLNLKNGRPFAYDANIQAQHRNHVHVAIDLGRPGVGDGGGKDGLATVAAAAKAAGIDPAILYGVWGQESGFSMGPGPTSRAGAQGPFQFMPGTARSLGVDPHNFRSAAYGAARYLAQYKGRGTAGMLAAYNAGPGAKPPYPRETQNYIPSVIAISRRWPGVAGSSKGSSSAARHVSATGGAIGTSAPAASTATPDTTSPYDLAIAGSDVEIAEAQQSPVRHGAGGRIVSSPALAEAQAQSNRLGIVNARIRKVQAGLRKHLRPATRLRLRQELAQLLGERASITGRITELGQPADTGSGDTTTGAGGAGDTGADGEQADPNQALIDAINAKAEQDRQLAEEQAARDEALRQATAEHTQALKGVNDELKRQTDFATAVQSTETFQLKKMLADVVSNQLGGFGVAPRSYTPGLGVKAAY